MRYSRVDHEVLHPDTKLGETPHTDEAFTIRSYMYAIDVLTVDSYDTRWELLLP